MNKKLMQDRFSKNLDNYNTNAKIQKKMAEKLVKYIDKDHYNSILEIGCGTGFLTEMLSQKVSYEKYIALDIVNDCKNYINDIDSAIEFINDDAENYIKNCNSSFDLIISNASFQWFEDFEATTKLFYSKLNQNGDFIFSTFGKENFREIYQVQGASLNYYSIKELKEFFINTNIRNMEEEVHIMAFSSPREVLKHLQLTGVNGIENTHWTKADLKAFENAYTNYCSQRPTLTYNPIYVHLC